MEKTLQIAQDLRIRDNFLPQKFSTIHGSMYDQPHYFSQGSSEKDKSLIKFQQSTIYYWPLVPTDHNLLIVSLSLWE